MIRLQGTMSSVADECLVIVSEYLNSATLMAITAEKPRILLILHEHNVILKHVSIHPYFLSLKTEPRNGLLSYNSSSSNGGP